jgi:nicotinamide riboside transporter PnuC
MPIVEYLDQVSQVALVILGPLAIILVAKKNRWGFVAGLLSQPFWFITALINQQWGVFLVSIIFTGSWILGIWEWFLRDDPQKS